MSYRKHLVSNDISPSEMYEAIAVDYDTDTISRAKAIDGKICIQRANGVEIYDDYAVPVEYLKQLPPAQPKKGVIEQIKWERDVAIEQLKKLGYGLGEKIRAEKDCISRQAAIEAVNSLTYPSSLVDVKRKLVDLPTAQLAPDQNGDLWVTVPDIDKVTCVYVQESKSKFCRIFYEERI